MFRFQGFEIYLRNLVPYVYRESRTRIFATIPISPNVTAGSPFFDRNAGNYLGFATVLIGISFFRPVRQGLSSFFVHLSFMRDFAWRMSIDELPLLC